MPITEVEKIWMDGELVNWQDAQVHVLSHALHYGSGVFEGIRAYETVRGPAVWHLDEHLKRLYRKRAAVVLHPAARVPWVRRDRREPAGVSGERDDRGVAVGRLPR